MAWIFALGIIWLCLIHDGFRKLCFWLGGLGIVGIMIAVAAGLH